MASLPVKAVKNPANTGRVSLVSRRLRASRRRRPDGRAEAGGRGWGARHAERRDQSRVRVPRIESSLGSKRFGFSHFTMHSSRTAAIRCRVRFPRGCIHGPGGGRGAAACSQQSYNTAARSWTAPIMALTTQRLSLALGLRPSWRPFACAAAPG